MSFRDVAVCATTLALVSVGVTAAEEPFPPGVVVEKVRPGCAGDVAGLRAGDVLLAWSPPSAGAAAPEQPLASPFDLREIEASHLPLGPVTIRGLRSGKQVTAHAPADTALWIDARPAFPGPVLELYERGRELVKEAKLEDGIGAWREAAEAVAGTPGGEPARCWLFLQSAQEWARAGKAEAAASAHQETVACARGLPPVTRAAVLEQRGQQALNQGRHPEAAEAYQGALEARREAGSGAISRATCELVLAYVDVLQGRVEEGLDRYGRITERLESEAPANLTLAMAWTYLAWMATSRGDLDRADALYPRAAKMAETLSPRGSAHATILSGLGGQAGARGDFQAAARHYRRALEIHQGLSPESREITIDLLNLGVAAGETGDLEEAEDLFRQALTRNQANPEARGVRAVLLNNLGSLAVQRGDLEAAESYQRQALAIYTEVAPRSGAATMIGLGETLRLRGDGAGARAQLAGAVAILETQAPQGWLMAAAVSNLGDVARSEGDWTGADDYYQRARAIWERLNPVGMPLAETLHGIGALQRARGQRQEAAATFARALEAVEAQRGRLVGSDRARSAFTGHVLGIYQSQIEVLAELGRGPEALHVLERSRARALLELLAERDLVDRDVPAALEERRRRTDAEYNRAQAGLERLNASKDAAEIDRIHARLRELRGEQERIRDEVRSSSPRLAGLRYPEPLDLAGIHAALEPGTVLVAYSVGQDRTTLFAVRKVPDGEPVVVTAGLPIGRTALAESVRAFRERILQAGPEAELAAEAGALYEALLGPADSVISAAQRILICPDGPLHTLPFAALKRRGRYLVEWKPHHTVVSATVYAELRRSRPDAANGTRLLAFGDPLYPLPKGTAAGAPNPVVLEDVKRSLDLRPLPASRREVQAIVSLYGTEARAYLGAQATEETAKAESGKARYVHFACHGFLDERMPLNSGLALTIRPQPGEGQDNGLLQAWEIIERVRLDADLVTLSACQSGLGKETGGEGLLGLTRAFQYAGARSVLATLWSVPDRSTADLMRHFYGGLRRGLSKDEALRRAQLGLVHGGRARSHPLRWAGFQLSGDWR